MASRLMSTGWTHSTSRPWAYNPSCGYYGTKGYNIVCKYIGERLLGYIYHKSTLRTPGMINMEATVWALDVLGEHIFTRLVIDDMKFGWNDAVRMLKESDSVGFDLFEGKRMYEQFLDQAEQKTAAGMLKEAKQA